jgi:2,5-dihydroxypyridine 5,6-dioxygenase
VVILPYSRYVTDRIHLEIEDGHVVSIEGGVDATLMREWLKRGEEHEGDRDPYAISHLGWGLNPQCRWDSIALYGDTPERSHAAQRCFPGNFLFSTGPNSQGGGKRTTRGHYDVPMRDCTIELDGKVVVEHGRLVDPKMIVPEVKRG